MNEDSDTDDNVDFTPWSRDRDARSNGEKHHLRISKAEYDELDAAGVGWGQLGIVRDLLTDVRYIVYRGHGGLHAQRMPE